MSYNVGIKSYSTVILSIRIHFPSWAVGLAALLPV